MKTIISSVINELGRQSSCRHYRTVLFCATVGKLLLACNVGLKAMEASYRGVAYWHGSYNNLIQIVTALLFTPISNRTEEHLKPVLVHREFMPILKDIMIVTLFGNNAVFFSQYQKGHRKQSTEAIKNCRLRVCNALAWDRLWLLFLDLHHTWKSKARHSGMHPKIEMAIMGYSDTMNSDRLHYGICYMAVQKFKLYIAPPSTWSAHLKCSLVWIRGQVYSCLILILLSIHCTRVRILLTSWARRFIRNAKLLTLL